MTAIAYKISEGRAFSAALEKFQINTTRAADSSHYHHSADEHSATRATPSERFINIDTYQYVL